MEFTGRAVGSGGDFSAHGTTYEVDSGVFACAFVLANQIAKKDAALHVGITVGTDFAPRIVVGGDNAFTLAFPAGSLFGAALGFTAASNVAVLTGGKYLAIAQGAPLLGWYPPFARADQSHWELDTDSQFTGAVGRTGVSVGFATAARVYSTQCEYQAVPAAQVFLAAATSIYEPYRTLENLVEGSRVSTPVARATDPSTAGVFYIPDYQALPADTTYGSTYQVPNGHSASWIVALQGIDYFAASTPDICTFVAVAEKSPYSARPFLPVTRARYACDLNIHTTPVPTFNATSVVPT